MADEKEANGAIKLEKLRKKILSIDVMRPFMTFDALDLIDGTSRQSKIASMMSVTTLGPSVHTQGTTKPEGRTTPVPSVQDDYFGAAQTYFHQVYDPSLQPLSL